MPKRKFTPKQVQEEPEPESDLESGGFSDGIEDSDDAELMGALGRHSPVEMLSDLEFGQSDDEDEALDGHDDARLRLPDAKAWGSKKAAYYNTDYHDHGYKQFTEEDEQQARQEEQEALSIQKRLIGEINDADLDMDWLIEADRREPPTEEPPKIVTDFTAMSKKARLAYLRQDAPELLPLLDECRSLLDHCGQYLEPVLALADRDGYEQLKGCSGYHLLETKYQLVARYATNIAFYLLLKSRRAPTANHEVVKQLLAYKRLIGEVERLLDEHGLSEQLRLITSKLQAGQPIELKAPGRAKKPKKAAVAFPEPAVDEGPVFDDAQAEQDEDEDSRRAITYEIAKNKGLTAQKRKELRNPRVKHRLKFKKAKQRRRGQVREPRKELKSYAGELSGINAGRVRSIKFKR